MAAKLKVFGMTTFLRGIGHQQVRAIVATTSKTKAAAAFEVSLYGMNGYGSETGNEGEITTATAKPGVVFWRPLDSVCRDSTVWNELPERKKP